MSFVQQEEKAYSEGWNAWKAHQFTDACPYELGSPLWGKWIEGWHDCRENYL